VVLLNFLVAYICFILASLIS